MTKIMKRIALCALAVGLAACACTPRPSPDPHEGMVEVYDGSGMTWLPLLENVAAAELDSADFTAVEGGYIRYAGEHEHGIDVSEHQGEIDWALAAQSGWVDFAFIRAGYRGYTEGGLFEDLFFRRNIEGALENGVAAGVYFFSQATTPEEAREEAAYVLELAAGYDLDLPIVYDWEWISYDEARTDGMTDEEITACALAFCQTVEEAGYDAAVYFYRHIGYHNYDLDQLAGYDFWVGAPGEAPDFYYRHEYWQYSFTGTIPGIEGEVDMNLRFFLPEETDSAPAE